MGGGEEKRKKGELNYVEAETTVGLAAGAPGQDLDRQVGRTRVADENETRRLVGIGAVRHPALLRYNLDVRNCKQKGSKYNDELDPTAPETQSERIEGVCGRYLRRSMCGRRASHRRRLGPAPAPPSTC